MLLTKNDFENQMGRIFGNHIKVVLYVRENNLWCRQASSF